MSILEFLLEQPKEIFTDYQKYNIISENFLSLPFDKKMKNAKFISFMKQLLNDHSKHNPNNILDVNKLQTQLEKQGFGKSGSAAAVKDFGEYLKAVGHLTKESNNINENSKVGQNIYNQIKKMDKSAFMSWGAKDFVNLNVGELGLQFKSSGMVKNKVIVQITLNGNDTYDIKYGKIRKMEWKILGTKTNVYVENLVGVLNTIIG